MSTAVWGAFLGGTAGAGLLLVLTRVAVLRRPLLSVRVLPYLRDVPRLDETAVLRPVVSTPTSAAARIFGPSLRRAADVVERVLGGSASVRRRLQRAGLDRTVQDFRTEQVVWGLVGFAAAAAVVLLRALGGVGGVASGLVFCLLGFAGGVFLRDNRLSTQVKERERQILVEFPTVAELLALSVAAGESPVAALDRVVRRSNGALSDDLAQVLARIRTGEPVGAAFESFARSTGLPIVARFATGITVAMERGTPLADVLHAQAADVREAGRRLLIETAARKEIAMMAPVVFFVLPVTILFAFYPGVLGLRLTTP
ncbi:type II secretion system F family protein [Nocardioides sp. zg-1228]|uniref:type II secretion system F family protein n=1 Tax=Nocardioides sp. zg-1228 TaxID=2763008 RepID=UPI0016425B1E|nr:type II secretion system F family protein [Nocardioides sp. zg-1228]MBC2933051.1 type II secretion system F family protein [Nocardioides sp. zg-1228]QSF56756.1 type II secretion system F family protein [Nocardioides sp. zg-1228]